MNSSYPALAEKKATELRNMLKGVLMAMLAGVLFVILLLMVWFLRSPLGAPASTSLTWLFSTDSVQAWWYITRAAGLTAYFLLWLSMAWGLALATKILQPVLENLFTFDFHEYLSLLGLGFVILHVIVLLFDKFLPFNLLQVLIPFIDSYRPFWVGLGVIGFYLFLLVTVTFYIRQRIGQKAFRAIHILSLLGYLGTTLHGLYAGTDSALPITKVLYAGSFLIILFLTVFWFVMNRLNQPKPVPEPVKKPQLRTPVYSGSGQSVKRSGTTNSGKRTRRR
jgi:methionine sulfoxide reductase heme-binding subunit